MADFWQGYIWPLIIIVLQCLAIVIPLLLAVAYLTYMERKVMAAMQLRRGPNVVGPWGLLQPIADGAKLFLKETVIPTGADRAVFVIAPVLTFFLALLAWVVIPFDEGWVVADINVGVLFLLAVSSLGVYGIVMAGWGSNSQYAFLGSMRSAAQMVSYEVSMGLIIISVLLSVGSLNLSDIVHAQRDGVWFVVLHLPMAVLFFISVLAETNRHPFDLPEDEASLVAGFHAEYSAMAFGMFFLGEYANMILMSAITTVLFLGGWLPPIDIAPFNWIPGVVWFLLKILLLLFFFIWARVAFPRYRYDQLMRLGWKIFLPFSLLWVVLTAAVLHFSSLEPWLS